MLALSFILCGISDITQTSPVYTLILFYHHFTSSCSVILHLIFVVTVINKLSTPHTTLFLHKLRKSFHHQLVVLMTCFNFKCLSQTHFKNTGCTMFLTLFWISSLCNLLQVVIVKLKMDKDRKKILERKARSRADDKGKGKHTEESVAMATD